MFFILDFHFFTGLFSFIVILFYTFTYIGYLSYVWYNIYFIAVSLLYINPLLNEVSKTLIFLFTLIIISFHVIPWIDFVIISQENWTLITNYKDILTILNIPYVFIHIQLFMLYIMLSILCWTRFCYKVKLGIFCDSTFESKFAKHHLCLSFLVYIFGTCF